MVRNKVVAGKRIAIGFLVVFLFLFIFIAAFAIYESCIGNWRSLSVSCPVSFRSWDKIEDKDAVRQINQELKRLVSHADEKHLLAVNQDDPNLGGGMLLRAGIRVIFISFYQEYAEITIGLFQYRFYRSGEQYRSLSELCDFITGSQ